MTYTRNLYDCFITKCLLTVLYVLLLAPQFNSNFYNIANFYSPSLNKIYTAACNTKSGIVTDTQNKFKVRHLSLDKRFLVTTSNHPDLFRQDIGYFAFLYPRKTIDQPTAIFNSNYIVTNQASPICKRGPPVAYS